MSRQVASEELVGLADELAERGVRLAVAGDGLRVSAPKGAVTPELRDRLARYKPELLAHLRARSAAAMPIEALPRDGRSFPLSPNQQGLWLLDQLDGHQPTYVLTGGVRLEGPLDAGLLERCLSIVVSRHEALRTAFRAGADGLPRQIVLPAEPVELPRVDLTDVPESEQDAEVARHAAEVARTPFDLAQGRLLRLRLLRLAPRTAHLLLSVHHIVADAWSLQVLFTELFALYSNAGDMSAANLPEIDVQYPDVAAWRAAATSAVDTARHLGAWREVLAGAPPVLDLPTDRPRPPRQSFRGDVVRFTVDAELTRGIGTLAREAGVTPYTVLLAAWAVVLGRYARVDEVVIGSPMANRDRPETQNLIGFFVNTLALRIDLSGNPTFAELLHRTRRVCLDGFAHQELPFEHLVAELRPERSLSHSPIFQAMFVQYDTPQNAVSLGSVTAKPDEVHNGTSKFDLTLLVEDQGGTLSSTLEYAVELFEPETAQRLGTSWQQVLATAVRGPDTPVAALPLLDPAEARAALEAWNATGTDADLDTPVHHIVTEQSRTTPDAPAVVFGSASLSYAELEAAANRLAHVLLGHGTGPGTLVALCASRSIEQIVAVLAVLKADAAFVAIDPASPLDRIAFTLSDARTPILLTESGLVDGLPVPEGTEVLLLDELDTSDAPDSVVDVHTGRDDLAYVIYTSGSTGMPKGVAMRHEGLANMVAWQVRRTPFSADDRTLQFAPLNFDICLQESFATWAAGGTLVLVAEDVRRDATALLDYLVRERITRLFLPYVVLQQLAEVAVARQLWPTDLLDVFAAGEQLHITPQLVELFTRVPATLHNHYGPTEAHVVTAYTLEGPATSWPTLPPVGRPIDNVRIHLLDEHGAPVPPGVPGEVYVAGPCLARGYLHRPELTDTVFQPDPFSAEPGARRYRTGDLARIRPDGELEFLGRIDGQVKVRGFRVELGEIETRLMSHPAVSEAVVDVRGATGAQQRLVAWIVPRSGAALDAAELREHCRTTLPDHMVPNLVVPLTALPLTNAGKIERRLLPEPSPEALRGDREYVEPATPLEKSVAAAFAEVLGVERVGAEDDFFELGGHSLAATRVALRLAAEQHLDVPVRLLFERPTPAGLAEALDLLGWATSGAQRGGADVAGADLDREVGEL